MIHDSQAQLKHALSVQRKSVCNNAAAFLWFKFDLFFPAVHHGLVIPGQQNKVEVRCGSSLGVGIYLSPDPDFSFQ